MHYVSFRDLQARGIVTSWVHLGRMVESQNFPAGYRLGKRRRMWLESEVQSWLDAHKIVAKSKPAKAA